VKLRTLNVSRNNFTSLPMRILSQLPLIELNASRNALGGEPLFPSCVTDLPILQRLTVSSCNLTSLTSASELSLPSLIELDISFNRITALPDVSSWFSLATLSAEDNALSTLPKGFTSLQTVRSVNLTGNDIARLDPRIANMEGLTTLNIAANPIRETKFLSMSTDALKETLRQRLAAPEMDPLMEMMQSFGSLKST
jgi:Leucine-rich repeat (LRR) protein